MSYDDGSTPTCEECDCYNCGDYVCKECYDNTIKQNDNEWNTVLLQINSDWLKIVKRLEQVIKKQGVDKQ